MTEPERPDPLAALGERLERARRAQEGGRRAGDAKSDPAARSAIGLAFRIGLELVVGVFVGFAIGWALDDWLGTQPWGMIGFLFLGFAAGVFNVFRVATGTSRAVGYMPRRKDVENKAGEHED